MRRGPTVVLFEFRIYITHQSTRCKPQCLFASFSLLFFLSKPKKKKAYGDLDESKLVEGLTGEKAIYKRRGDQEPEPGSPQEKPKRLKLVVDVSGSMYRFNGVDGRMDRQLEAILMLMESLENHEQKICYDIVGKSYLAFSILR